MRRGSEFKIKGAWESTEYTVPTNLRREGLKIPQLNVYHNYINFCVPLMVQMWQVEEGLLRYTTPTEMKRHKTRPGIMILTTPVRLTTTNI